MGYRKCHQGRPADGPGVPSGATAEAQPIQWATWATMRTARRSPARRPRRQIRRACKRPTGVAIDHVTRAMSRTPAHVCRCFFRCMVTLREAEALLLFLRLSVIFEHISVDDFAIEK